MHALVIDGTVMQLWPERPVLHPDLLVLEVPEGVAVQEGWSWDGETFHPPAPPPPPPLEERRAAMLRALDAARDDLLAAGAPYGGTRVVADDKARADLSGLATTAALVLMGALPGWPEDYARGWIAADNSRLPLPAPADGIALAAAVAGWYAALVQHTRDRKDLALASEDPEAVLAATDWSAFEPAPADEAPEEAPPADEPEDAA